MLNIKWVPTVVSISKRMRPTTALDPAVVVTETTSRSVAFKVFD